ncbi:hypothetical protein K1X76_07250 [bacterium]|nr:hypothetical protein [bacterium]
MGDPVDKSWSLAGMWESAKETWNDTVGYYVPVLSFDETNSIDVSDFETSPDVFETAPIPQAPDRNITPQNSPVVSRPANSNQENVVVVTTDPQSGLSFDDLGNVYLPHELEQSFVNEDGSSVMLVEECIDLPKNRVVDLELDTETGLYVDAQGNYYTEEQALGQSFLQDDGAVVTTHRSGDEVPESLFELIFASSPTSSKEKASKPAEKAPRVVNDVVVDEPAVHVAAVEEPQEKEHAVVSPAPAVARSADPVPAPVAAADAPKNSVDVCQNAKPACQEGASQTAAVAVSQAAPVSVADTATEVPAVSVPLPVVLDNGLALENDGTGVVAQLVFGGVQSVTDEAVVVTGVIPATVTGSEQAGNPVVPTTGTVVANGSSYVAASTGETTVVLQASVPSAAPQVFPPRADDVVVRSALQVAVSDNAAIVPLPVGSSTTAQASGAVAAMAARRDVMQPGYVAVNSTPADDLHRVSAPTGGSLNDQGRQGQSGSGTGSGSDRQQTQQAPVLVAEMSRKETTQASQQTVVTDSFDVVYQLPHTRTVFSHSGLTA